MNQEYLFNFNNELTKYVTKEVKSFINKYNEDNIIYNYNRMTIEEIVQECMLKIIKSNNGSVNKSYVRYAVRTTCIDLYRKAKDVDIDFFLSNYDGELIDTEDLTESSMSEEEAFEEVIIEDSIKDYEPLFQSIIILKLQGYNNTEIKRTLGIAHDTFYRYLRKIKNT